MAAGNRMADTSGTAGVGQKNKEIKYVAAAIIKNDEPLLIMTLRKGATIFTSASKRFNEFNKAVIKVMTRKILKSSLAATKLAENILINPLIGLPVRAVTTKNVPITEGTTTFARNIIVIIITMTPSK